MRTVTVRALCLAVDFSFIFLSNEKITSFIYNYFVV